MMTDLVVFRPSYRETPQPVTAGELVGLLFFCHAHSCEVLKGDAIDTGLDPVHEAGSVAGEVLIDNFVVKRT